MRRNFYAMDEMEERAGLGDVVGEELTSTKK